jgi:hypothetical protein
MVFGRLRLPMHCLVKVFCLVVKKMERRSHEQKKNVSIMIHYVKSHISDDAPIAERRAASIEQGVA